MSTNHHEILVIDDSPLDVRMLSAMLTQHGYVVRTAQDGASGLVAAWASAPDLILLDIKMIDLDGYEVCRRLKNDPRTQDVPVIFVSALADSETKFEAFTVGGADYVAKPFEVKEVVARVRTHLGFRDLQRELRRTNQELAQRLQELEARNEELDAFAHTVAHDLKNPLQLILGLNELLLDDYADGQGPEILEMLRTISRMGTKMNSIIDELLLLSSLNRQSVDMRELDMAAVVHEALSTLVVMIDERQAQVIVPPAWPGAAGYAPWVEEVWINYISNAIKYGGTPPVVELGATCETEGWVRFWVRDNGKGIASREQDRLFLPLERLDPLHVEGEGLGLSIVHRIMSKLGGRVGVESTLGEGSTFYFTLPAAK